MKKPLNYALLSGLLLSLIVAVFLFCRPRNYAFFTAGHLYGNPVKQQEGCYPPFLATKSAINEYGMAFGVLTGDVVQSPTAENWDRLATDLNGLSMPLHIAPGNHDRSPEFEKRYPAYYSFHYQGDLMIVLSSHGWSIKGEQQKWFYETLKTQSPSVRNIFVFCHELLWWKPDNVFGQVKINYAPHYPGNTNYWEEIDPFLRTLPNKVVIYAGDLGASHGVDAYMFYQYENISLVASGMGGGKMDNFIITEVASDGQIDFKMVGLADQFPIEIADIEAYQLPDSIPAQQ